jgi:peroxiredoxin Q/BCP
MLKLLTFAACLAVASLVLADDPAQTNAIPDLKAGDALPDFTLVDDQGRDWKLSERAAAKATVLYFYPGDFTVGCTAQAQKFHDSLKELTALGAEVVGISGDKAESHKLFKDAYGLEHTLLADPDGAVAKQLGVPVGRGGKARLVGPDRQPVLGPDGKSVYIERPVTIERWTFVIDREGKVISKRKTVNPATDAADVLEIVKKLP